MALSSEDFLCEDDFEVAILAIFCSYRYGANVSEAVEKITTDEKDYQIKCSLCVIVCIATANQ